MSPNLICTCSNLFALHYNFVVGGLVLVVLFNACLPSPNNLLLRYKHDAVVHGS